MVDKEGEEEQYRDLTLLMELLTNLLSKDFIDLSPPEAGDAAEEVGAGVKYIAHCTLHTAHCTLHAARCTLHAAHCTLHTAGCDRGGRLPVRPEHHHAPHVRRATQVPQPLPPVLQDYHIRL